MTVAFSESDITEVRVGQPATVTVDALSGVELAAHVSAISPLGSTSNSVVSYDATLTLDQLVSAGAPGHERLGGGHHRSGPGCAHPNSAISGQQPATVNETVGGRRWPPRSSSGSGGTRGPRSSAA